MNFEHYMKLLSKTVSQEGVDKLVKAGSRDQEMSAVKYRRFLIAVKKRRMELPERAPEEKPDWVKFLCRPCAEELRGKGGTLIQTGGKSRKENCERCHRRRYCLPYQSN